MKQALILFGCALALAATTHAVELRNVTTGTQLFFDNFETNAVTPSTANAYDGSVDADPIAMVGSWGANENSNGIIQVTTSTTAPDPVPFQGSRDLRVYRDSSHDQNDLLANLTSAQSTPGDLIHLSMMVYIPTSQNTTARAQFLLVGSNLKYTTARAWLQNNVDGYVHVIGPGYSETLAVPYLTGTWQEWTLDYAVNSTTFKVSVGTNSVSGMPSFTSGDVYAADLFNGANSPAGSFYLDAVIPEPTSVALLALGGLMLWRRRK